MSQVCGTGSHGAISHMAQRTEKHTPNAKSYQAATSPPSDQCNWFHKRRGRKIQGSQTHKTNQTRFSMGGCAEEMSIFEGTQCLVTL